MKEKSIKINAILNVLLTLSNIVFPLITFPYISRVLNPTGVGVTSFFTSISSYCTLAPIVSRWDFWRMSLFTR